MILSHPTRARILAAARDLFVEDGADAVTMRAVAAAVGLTPMALYRHFRSRAALLRAVRDEGHEIFLAYLQRALAEPSPVARLTRAGQEYLNFALEHPRDYTVMFMRPMELPAERGATPEWRDVATFRFLVDRVRECAAAGVLGADDPESAALSIWAHVHGLVSLHLAGKLHLDEGAFRALFTRSIADLARVFPWSAAAEPGKRPRRARA